MRIERLRVDAFGRIRDLDSGATPLSRLVVVVGPNEAGKSTLFHFLTSMLYGFRPASRDGNPYSPWNGPDASGSVSLRLDGGDLVDVERRLLSAPSGRMVTGGQTDDLRNRALPWAEHIPRAVFRQVFAVTLSEMASLDEETWARVQDRILGSMGSTDLRPARLVVADLEQEANEIWRPTRRGNQLARGLATQVVGLRAQRREAQERDRRLRELSAEVDQLRTALQDAREARQAALVAVDRVQSLIPIRTQLMRIAALREDAGPPQALAGLPADPAAELEARAAAVSVLRRRMEALAAESAEPRAAVEALDDRDRRLLDRADEVAAFLAQGASLTSDRDRAASLDQEMRDLRRRIDGAAAQLLSAPLPPGWEQDVDHVAVAELRERIRALHSATDDRRRRETATLQAPPAPAPAAPPPLAVLAVILAGLVLLVVGLSAGGTPVLAAGVAVTLVGVVLANQWWRARAGVTTTAAAPAPDDAGVDGARAAEEQARESCAELVGHLPVLPSLLREPTEALTSGILRLQELLRDHRERGRTFQEVQERMTGADAAARALAGALDRGAGMDALALANLLERDLRQAERRAERAAASARELTRITRDQDRLRAELAEAEAGIRGLQSRLADAGDGEMHEGVRLVRERVQASVRANQLQDELERAHPDLDEIRSRIAAAEATGESWTVNDDDLARRKAAVEELTQRVEELATRAEALDRDIAHLRSEATVDAVDGEIAALEDEERALIHERDRRWVMAQLLRAADRRFREEHQPDVLRRAGQHLGTLTGGRYDRLMVDEASDGGRFQLSGPRLPAPVALAAPISTGTLEQAYLALRLAIVDHLDQGLERLPLFVDEVFVNWDRRRRAHGMDVLGTLARHRQLFVFTCHTDIARELADRGATTLQLGGGG